MTNNHASQRVGDKNVDLAKESLSQLLKDTRVPDSVRSSLSKEYQKLSAMLEKLEQQQLHIAVFGRVSVGKSSLLNALIGKDVFAVSLLHGETKTADQAQWQEMNAGGIYLIDTPGINEANGEEREVMAMEVASRSDLVLFVVDGDLTQTEMHALHTVVTTARPVILVINKADQYTQSQLSTLKSSIQSKVREWVDESNIVICAASPSEQTVVQINESGEETEFTRTRDIDVNHLKHRLWSIIEQDGKTLSALNASLFATGLSEQLGQKILLARQNLGQETIRLYCIAKGVAVALNPLPIADIIAAAAIDVGMVVHLSKLYGLPMSKSEASELLKTIAAQMLALYSTFWAIHFASSALKISTVGLSTVLTGMAQGGVAWYSTLVVGEATGTYLAKGKSWGELGPKLTVMEILDRLDRDSVVQDAKQEIKKLLNT
jgi:GTP-binding protein Era